MIVVQFSSWFVVVVVKLTVMAVLTAAKAKVLRAPTGKEPGNGD